MEVEISTESLMVRFEIDPADHIGKVIAVNRDFYEAELLRDLGRLVSRRGCAIDVGSNIGNHCIYFAKILGLRVEAFEPSEIALQLLRKNVLINDVSDKVGIHQEVVGSRSSSARLVDSVEGNLGATRFQEDKDGEFRQVRLDDIEYLEPVRILKVDAEGMDFDVLCGAEQVLANYRPVVAVECQTSSEFSKIRDWLQARSYVAVAVYNATDTFIFLPVGKPGEDEALLKFQSHRGLCVQRELRSIQKRMRGLIRKTDAIEELRGRLLVLEEHLKAKGVEKHCDDQG